MAKMLLIAAVALSLLISITGCESGLGVEPTQGTDDILPRGAISVGGNAVQVYVGGSRAYTAMTGANDSQWSYVRQNAQGWYVNNFMMNGRDGSVGIAYARAAIVKFTQKNLFYETDFLENTDGEDKANIDEFRGAGWKVALCTVNRGYDPNRKYALRWRDENRPVLRMVPPWKVYGNFYDARNSELQTNIKNCNGSSTDGPMTLWSQNSGDMRIRTGPLPGGSATLVTWTRAQNPNFTTMVMMAPNESTGAQFLSRVKDCVRMHERFGATPNVYVLSFYGPTSFNACPILPETVNGQPANTFMGAAYWLMKHLKDPVAYP